MTPYFYVIPRFTFIFCRFIFATSIYYFSNSALPLFDFTARFRRQVQQPTLNELDEYLDLPPFDLTIQNWDGEPFTFYDCRPTVSIVVSQKASSSRRSDSRNLFKFWNMPGFNSVPFTGYVSVYFHFDDHTYVLISTSDDPMHMTFVYCEWSWSTHHLWWSFNPHTLTTVQRLTSEISCQSWVLVATLLK